MNYPSSPVGDALAPEARAQHTPKWFVQDCLHAYGDIEVILGDDFKIYIPLQATDWDDAKRSRMKATAALIAAAPATAAERDRLWEANEKLVKALEKIAQIQRDKCENASAEILFMLLDNKVDIALAALAAARGEGS